MHLRRFPQRITDMSRVYFSSVNVIKSCKYINFVCQEWNYTSIRAAARMRAKQTECNHSESNMQFMIAVTVKGLL